MSEADLRPYLLEMRRCTQGMVEHATRLERAADEWRRVESCCGRAGFPPSPDTGPALPRTIQETVAALARDEAAVWRALDGFLCGWMRAARLLWPEPLNGTEASRRRRQSRSRGLLSTIGTADGHPLHNLDLLDRWMRFDELLDAAVTAQPDIEPCRFRAGRLGDRTSAVQELDILELTLVFEGLNRERFHLRPLFDGARDLAERTDRALLAR